MRAPRGVFAFVALVIGLVLSTRTVDVRAGQAPEPLYQELLTGDQKLLQPGYLVGNIAIADPRVCNFRVLPERKAVLLVATGEGHTTLTIFDQQGTKRDEIAIDVVSREFAKLRDDLTALVAPYAGVQVTSLGRRLTLTGTVATLEQVKELQRIASAAGDVTSLVTVRETSTSTPAPAATAAPRPTEPTPAPSPSPSNPRTARPTAPTPVPRGTATPVPLGAGSLVRTTPDPVGLGGSAPATASAIGASTIRSVDYSIELVQSPASAPPPDVLGPVGPVLFKTRLSVPVGSVARTFVSAGGAQASPVGLSVGVRPILEPDGRLRTALLVDTNLPIGPAGAGETQPWQRGVIEVVHGKGETLYVTERDLEAAFARGANGSDLFGRSSGNPADGRTTLDALGAMFRAPTATREGARRARESVLVIVVAPVDPAKEPRP